ncbi:uncharacterized protein MICPUCDRAFT_47542 [Micromonas pusilla CCMP1545]|uniref:Predicted protein n=1 Tax=Micromonas pusilla (strain CCMP1545) TaxID=564608 RepID=C1MUN0_MICPC|nr:uncharacterized protein MICPUCDRAFT_47542 [Micromonas pusilla CCMP1545]EEH56656.1 predicted protein [Micromonas pusilla CCMP1545]|eukprot:XP_003059524.1 predicted protein [Micromonas pusilla CCMP1545]
MASGALGEVITLQFGSRANWTGAHFWNFQDETQGLAESDDADASAYADLDSGVTYRVGETHSGAPTYVPRLVFFDLCGAMGGVKRAGHLYGDGAGVVGDGDLPPPVLTWDGGAAKVVRRDPERKSSFLRELEDDQERWRDEDDEGEDGADADDRMDTDEEMEEMEEEEEEDGRKRKKWGGGGGGGGGGGADAIDALRAKMTSHILASPGKKPKPKPKPSLSSLDAEAKRAKEEAKKKRREEAAARLEASAARLETPGEVNSWTDFGKAMFHPRSACLLTGLWHGVDAFAGFGEGAAWIETEDRREEVRDRIRFFAEECDALRGFNVLLDDLGGFGGFAAAALEELRDEYGSATPTCAHSLRASREELTTSSASPDDARGDFRAALLNEALASATLGAECELYAPLQLGLRPLSASRAKLLAGLDARSKYHGTALAAACVESSSTPWRTRARDGVGAGDMRATARRVNADGPFVAVDAWFPCGAVASAGELAREEEAKQRRRAEKERSGSGFEREEEARDAAARERAASLADDADAVALTPGCVDRDVVEPRAELYVLRGARTHDGARASVEDARRGLDAALRAATYRVPRTRCVHAAPLPLPLPFPSLFASGGGPSSRNPSSAPIMTRVASTSTYGAELRRVNDEWRRASRAGAGKALLSQWGVAADDAEETSETLLTLARKCEGGEDSGDDDDDEEEVERM